MSFYDIFRSFILPLGEMDKALPAKGTIVDLGCGQGIVTKYLAKKPERFVVGVERDLKRMPTLKAKNLKFVPADIRKFILDNAKGVIISDVLHHLNRKDQKALIKRIFASLEKEGKLIIKEIDSSESIRSRLSRLWDFILYPKDKISYWDSHDLKTFLQKIGFKVKTNKAARLFPGSTVLFICTK